jgi:hypothetical protein
LMPRPRDLADLKSLQAFPPVCSFMGVTPFPWVDMKEEGRVSAGSGVLLVWMIR